MEHLLRHPLTLAVLAPLRLSPATSITTGSSTSPIPAQLVLAFCLEKRTELFDPQLSLIRRSRDCWLPLLLPAIGNWTWWLPLMATCRCFLETATAPSRCFRPPISLWVNLRLSRTSMATENSISSPATEYKYFWAMATAPSEMRSRYCLLEMLVTWAGAELQ